MGAAINNLLFLISLLAVIVPLNESFAAEKASIKTESRFETRQNSEVFVDHDDLYSDISKILGTDAQFLPYSDWPLDLTRSRYWLRIPLSNDGTRVKRTTLNFALPSLPYVRAYLLSDGLTVTELMHLDIDSKFDDRPSSDPLLMLPLEVMPGRKQVLYLHIKPVVSGPLGFGLIDSSEVIRFRQNETIINFTILGFIAAFLVVSVMLMVGTRSRHYVIYGVLVFCVLMLITDISGYVRKYMLPNHHFLALRSVDIWISLVFASYLYFIHEVFELSNRAPRLGKVVICFAGLQFIVTLLSLFVQTKELQIVLAPPIALLLICVAVVAWRRQFSGYIIFTISIISKIIFVFVLALISLHGFSPIVSFGPLHYVKIGYTLELVYFAIFLSLKYREMQIEKQQAYEQRVSDAHIIAQSEREKASILAKSQEILLNFAGVTHDIRQPLASIRLAVAGANNVNLEVVRQHIDATAEHAQEIVDSTLDQVEVDYYSQEETVLLGSVFGDVVKNNEYQAAAHGINLRSYESGLEIVSSRLVLERVLDNLVSNAIQHSCGTAVLIGVRRGSDGLLIKVIDNGIGFDVEETGSISQPFKVKRPGESGIKGFGLGLYIASVLCHRCGYAFSIQSVPGKGSVCSVYIPSP